MILLLFIVLLVVLMLLAPVVAWLLDCYIDYFDSVVSGLEEWREERHNKEDKE